MPKTYLPTLRIIVQRTKTYMSRWQVYIEEGLTQPQIDAFRECLTCLISLAALLGPEPTPE